MALFCSRFFSPSCVFFSSAGFWLFSFSLSFPCFLSYFFICLSFLLLLSLCLSLIFVSLSLSLSHHHYQTHNLTNPGGENISSVALESILASHASILEAAVVAVPDTRWGERPKAFVTVRAGQHIVGEEIVRWARDQSGMSGFMVPREVEVVEALPKTSTGKVRKNLLREWAKGGKRVME